MTTQQLVVRLVLLLAWLELVASIKKASEVGLAVGLPLDLAPRHHLLVRLLLQELTPDLDHWVRMQDPGSFGSGSRIWDCWRIGIQDPGFVGSRIRLIEEQRRPAREGTGAGGDQF